MPVFFCAVSAGASGGYLSPSAGTRTIREEITLVKTYRISRKEKIFPLPFFAKLVYNGAYDTYQPI